VTGALDITPDTFA